MSVAIQIPHGTTLFQGTCRECTIGFAVLESDEALQHAEYHPRFCPFCARRAVFLCALPVDTITTTVEEAYEG